MKAGQARICVLRIEGTNCEEEMFLSFKRLGARPEMVHLKQLTGTDSLSRGEEVALRLSHTRTPRGFLSR